ncbi:ABC transporter ATP-binding protein [Streptosporangium sp. V21-05]|uniref:ABC transporter ATP-binding protein n=1 Tax=Streptosporangium sp. V21-05 TaxID=3446115 RepID=UPI003F53A2EA
MTAVLEAQGLGRKYGRRWALRECTVDIPAGHVVGLVGPNGAGKTTLLKLACGQLEPTSGDITVLGGRPGGTPAQLARVGFVAQDTPVYAGLTVAEHLRLGARLNPRWDSAMAQERIARLDLALTQRAGKLSGGQRAQLALTLGLAKRPELLILDEPVAALDPLARREFLRGLMEATVEHELSVLLSSHLVSDLERVCDYVIVLVDSRVQVAGEVDKLLSTHHRLTGPHRDPDRLPGLHHDPDHLTDPRRAPDRLPGLRHDPDHLTGPRHDPDRLTDRLTDPRRDPDRLPADQHVVSARHTDRQSTYVVRTDTPILDPAWTVSRLGLEDLVLAYMEKRTAENRRPALEVRR